MDLNYSIQKITVVLESSLVFAKMQLLRQPKYSNKIVKYDRSYYRRQSLSFF